MQSSKMTYLLHILLTLSFFISTSLAKQTPVRFCGKIKIQTLLNGMVLCKSQKLYFRTSIGLFPISSIDYEAKLLTISHSFSSSTHFVSPTNLSAGFPSPPQPNSLILLDCSTQEHHVLPFLRKCEASFHGASSCLVVDDTGNLDAGFHPRDLNCSKYRRVYRRSTLADVHEIEERFELGTRISFDIPDHVPNPCDECEKSHGNCGVGLRCVCHPKECKDKIVSLGVKMNPFGNVIFCLLSFIVLMVLFKGF